MESQAHRGIDHCLGRPTETMTPRSSSRANAPWRALTIECIRRLSSGCTPSSAMIILASSKTLIGRSDFRRIASPVRVQSSRLGLYGRMGRSASRSTVEPKIRSAPLMWTIPSASPTPFSSAYFRQRAVTTYGGRWGRRLRLVGRGGLRTQPLSSKINQEFVATAP